MGFSAASVDPLSYDFRFAPQDGNPEVKCTGKGISPEPSSDALAQFVEKIREALADEEGDGDEVLIHAVAELVSGKPSEDELRQLPPRIRNEYVQHLLRAFSPKA